MEQESNKDFRQNPECKTPSDENLSPHLHGKPFESTHQNDTDISSKTNFSSEEQESSDLDRYLDCSITSTDNPTATPLQDSKPSQKPLTTKSPSSSIEIKISESGSNLISKECSEISSMINNCKQIINELPNIKSQNFLPEANYSTSSTAMFKTPRKIAIPKSSSLRIKSTIGPQTLDNNNSISPSKLSLLKTSINSLFPLNGSNSNGVQYLPSKNNIIDNATDIKLENTTGNIRKNSSLSDSSISDNYQNPSLYNTFTSALPNTAKKRKISDETGENFESDVDFSNNKKRITNGISDENINGTSLNLCDSLNNASKPRCTDENIDSSKPTQNSEQPKNANGFSTRNHLETTTYPESQPPTAGQSPSQRIVCGENYSVLIKNMIEILAHDIILKKAQLKTREKLENNGQFQNSSQPLPSKLIESEPSPSKGSFENNSPENGTLRELSDHTTSSIIQNQPDDLKCAICLHLISEAFMTSCGHSFCYSCIKTHLETKLQCPTCRAQITRNQIFPNFSLNKILEKTELELTMKSLYSKLPSHQASARNSSSNKSDKDSLFSELQSLLSSENSLEPDDLEKLAGTILSKLKDARNKKSSLSNNLFRYFLNKLNISSRRELQDVYLHLQLVESDIHATEDTVKLGGTKYADENANIPPIIHSPMYHRYGSDELDFLSKKDFGLSKFQMSKIDTHFTDLKQLYFASKHRSLFQNKSTLNASITATINKISSYSSFQPEIVLRYGDGSNTAAIVSSIDFDKDDEIFAVSGVTRKIKIYDFSSAKKQSELWNVATNSRNNRMKWLRQIHSSIGKIGGSRDLGDWWPSSDQSDFQQNQNGVNSTSGSSFSLSDLSRLSTTSQMKQIMPIVPVTELANRYKISCLSYSPFVKGHLACTDYEGYVTVYDTNTNSPYVQFTEHEKRAWSVDFSTTDPNKLCSGSDDGKVKIWSLNTRSSVMTIEGKANICCVRFNPELGNMVAFGSADHDIHYYDIRSARQPLAILKEHRKAVSYVRFFSPNLVVSASTDSTLKLWDLKTNKCVRTYQGHTNEKNFVGLSVSSSGWLSCGSENNTVYTYDIGLTKPVIEYKFNSSAPTKYDDLTDKDPSLFVSAVCWKRNSNTLIAANSQGSIRTLNLE
ncbi:hypothetical protein BB558_004502 [Smittium angustum]|uniref:RING-type domain-containing protein n=1 Tax=Smittium angustum TaxID=133377 RepID=A0A2U1J342_SMIAN|nr:hypothetical protein BB558_004502 [Smittium angustum]